MGSITRDVYKRQVQLCVHLGAALSHSRGHIDVVLVRHLDAQLALPGLLDVYKRQPPMMPVGMVLMTASNLGLKLRMMASTAAKMCIRDRPSRADSSVASGAKRVSQSSASQTRKSSPHARR